jgi:hypothetical protein
MRLRRYPEPRNRMNMAIRRPSSSMSRARKWPVTPEVAGSSLVAPAENILQLGIFCCLTGRERPPASCASRADPAAGRKGPVCRYFLPSRQECAAAIPRDFHPGGPKRPKWAQTVAWAVTASDPFGATEHLPTARGPGDPGSSASGRETNLPSSQGPPHEARTFSTRPGSSYAPFFLNVAYPSSIAARTA